MHAHINGTLRGMLVIGAALATSATAIAGDQLATSNSPAIHLAPYLPRYNPPAPAASASPSLTVAAVPPLSSGSPATLIAQNAASNVAPAASLSPSETVVEAPVVDAPPKPLHHLTGGVSLESQLREWAKSDGWSLSVKSL